MKRYAYVPVAVAAWLLPYTTFAQIDSIAQIRSEYAAINRQAASLNRQVVSLNDRSSEGGEVTIYRNKNGAVRLVREVVMGETGKVQREYYYEANVPFFVFEVTTRYNAPIYLPQFNPSLSEKSEERYYFLHGKMVRWLHGKESIKSVDPTFAKKERTLLEEAREWLERVK